MQKFNFSYDRENDDLFLFSPGSKSKGSVEMGDLILDYNSKKELVGLQIMKASKMLREMTGGKSRDLVSEVLNNLKECKVDIRVKNNLLIVKVYLSSKANEISPVISVPSIREPSPALAYA